MSSQQQHEDQPQHYEGEYYKPQGHDQPQHDDINHEKQHDGEDYEEKKGEEEVLKPDHEHNLVREERTKRAPPPSPHLAAGDSQNDQQPRYMKENQQQNTKTRPLQKKIPRRPLHRPQQSSQHQQHQQQQIEQPQINQKKEGGSGKNTLKLRLDLNLDIEITLKAKIHGDLTLALLDM